MKREISEKIRFTSGLLNDIASGEETARVRSSNVVEILENTSKENLSIPLGYVENNTNVEVKGVRKGSENFITRHFNNFGEMKDYVENSIGNSKTQILLKPSDTIYHPFLTAPLEDGINYLFMAVSGVSENYINTSISGVYDNKLDDKLDEIPDYSWDVSKISKLLEQLKIGGISTKNSLTPEEFDKNVKKVLKGSSSKDGSKKPKGRGTSRVKTSRETTTKSGKLNEVRTELENDPETKKLKVKGDGFKDTFSICPKGRKCEANINGTEYRIEKTDKGSIIHVYDEGSETEILMEDGRVVSLKTTEYETSEKPSEHSDEYSREESPENEIETAYANFVDRKGRYPATGELLEEADMNYNTFRKTFKSLESKYKRVKSGRKTLIKKTGD